ncbi:MAG: leucine-rich repeat domain-containing protein [Bacteroidales bacterium]|nr:leucine-rich repeat domain-containing protein [Bacteroidales bacterium]
MKKGLHILVATLFAAVSSTAFAYDFAEGNVYYRITSVSERTAEVTYQPDEFDPNFTYQSYTGEVFIPATASYNSVVFKVTGIGENAFRGCTGLSKVILSEGLQYIGAYAFQDCVNLTDVDIPNTVLTLGDAAFGCCHSFKHVVIPPSVIGIGDMTFYSEGVESITIQDDPSGINAGGYWGRSFAFPNVLQAYIGRNCGGWQAPSSLIDNWYGNGKLQRVEFGPYVTEIPYCILYGAAWNLTELILSPNTTVIRNGALAGCYALTRLELPDSVVEIEDGIMNGGWDNVDMGITDLVIGSNIRSIGSEAFTGCRKLKTVTVRSTIPIAIPEDAFHAQTYMNATLYVPEGTMEHVGITELDKVLIRTDEEFKDTELADSAMWQQMFGELWQEQGFPEGYFSDTVYIYASTTVNGYAYTNYWSNFLFKQEGEPSAISRVNADAQPESRTAKMLRNGRFLIRKDQKYYDPLGRESR